MDFYLFVPFLNKQRYVWKTRLKRGIFYASMSSPRHSWILSILLFDLQVTMIEVLSKCLLLHKFYPWVSFMAVNRNQQKHGVRKKKQWLLLWITEGLYLIISWMFNARTLAVTFIISFFLYLIAFDRDKKMILSVLLSTA